jgi:DNA polymerase/3'-5' exonuclease PolX
LVTINKWVKSGLYNLTDLRRAVSKGVIVLTHAQKLGLKYYADLNERMPRLEVTTIGSAIYKIMAATLPGIRFEISGSYRRGSKDSGDIDIISSHDKYQKDLLYKLRDKLEDSERYIDTIGLGDQRFTFLYRSTSGKVRQIDILWIPQEYFWASVLYFTGSATFNTIMRGVAKKQGYRLNQMGLYKVKKDKLILVPVKTEREIFDVLNMSYVPPENRNV